MLNTRKFKRFTKHLEVISRFDQFCDYTSIVGFRLLHSGNPTWVRSINILSPIKRSFSYRLLTLSFLSAFCIMVLVQTRDAFLRFFDDSFKPMPRFEASQTDPIYRAGIMVCTEQQVAWVWIKNDIRAFLKIYFERLWKFRLQTSTFWVYKK